MRGPGRQLSKLAPSGTTMMKVERHAIYGDVNDADAEEMHAMMTRANDPRFTAAERATAKRLAEAAAQRVMKKRKGA